MARKLKAQLFAPKEAIDNDRALRRFWRRFGRRFGVGGVCGASTPPNLHKAARKGGGSDLVRQVSGESKPGELTH